MGYTGKTSKVFSRRFFPWALERGNRRHWFWLVEGQDRHEASLPDFLIFCNELFEPFPFRHPDPNPLRSKPPRGSPERARGPLLDRRVSKRR